MLENLYTTKMSANKKTLQNRFAKIRSKNGRISRVTAVVMSCMVAVTMLGATVVMAAYDGAAENAVKTDYTGELKNDNQSLNDDVAAARAVVEEYFRAANEKGKRGELETLTAWYNTPNVVLTSDGDAVLTLKNIHYDPNNTEKEDYINYGRGSITNISLDDVIVFRVDYCVSIPQGGDAGAYSEGDYTDWKMILIRDGKDGKWLIDDMGY